MPDKNHWSGKSFTGANWDVYQGDALEVMKKLPSRHFNCVVTSPPYHWLRNYGVPGQIGHEHNVSSYVKAITNIMDEVYRSLSDDGFSTHPQSASSECAFKTIYSGYFSRYTRMRR
jgi:hypothetical protein